MKSKELLSETGFVGDKFHYLSASNTNPVSRIPEKS